MHRQQQILPLIGVNSLEDEISLWELAEAFWKDKWIIVIITAVSVLITYLTTMINTPAYVATSTVSVDYSEAEHEVTRKLNSFATFAKSDAAFQRVIDKLELDRQEYSIQSMRSNIRVEIVRNTNLIQLTYKGNHPEMVANIANQLAYELGAHIETAERKQEIVELQRQMKEIENQISIATTELEESSKLLDETPQYLVTRQSLVDEPNLQSAIAKALGGRDVGALQLETVIVNPVHTLLQERIAENTLALNRLTREREKIRDEIVYHNRRIMELERQFEPEVFSSSNPQEILSRLNMIDVSQASVPAAPEGNNFMLRMAISFIIGLLVSLPVVLIRRFWKVQSSSQLATEKKSSS
jgi:Capsular polysaccharide biosynthesis protein